MNFIIKRKQTETRDDDRNFFFLKKFTLPNFSICTTGTPFDKSTNNKRKQFIDNTTDVNYEKVKLNKYDVKKTKTKNI